MMAPEAARSGLAARTLPAFSIAAAVTYFVVMGFGISSFIYYPQVGEWRLVRQAESGPPMFFYGWVVDAALAGLIAAGVAAVLPPRIPLALFGAHSWLAWVVPVGLTLAIMFLLRSYFGL